MHQIHIPSIPIPDNTTFGELPELLSATMEALEAKDMMFPVLFYEVCDKPAWPNVDLQPSQAPERLLVLAPHAPTRDAVLRALQDVEKREPKLESQRAPRVTIKPNTPLRSVFKQMASIPMTVFSLTDGDDPDSTIFFIRTAFTLSEFRKELPRVLVTSGPPPEQN